MNKFIYGIALTLLLLPLHVLSQSSTNSPYSSFGLGEMDLQDYGRTSGMGGVGIGMLSDRMLNKSNPASYMSLDSLAFLLDLTLSLRSSDYMNSRGSFSTLNGGLKKLAIGFRVTPMWATVVGVKPFSNVGYNIKQIKEIEGTTETYTLTSKGDGGLSQFYFGNAFRITKNLSVGINSAFIFGSIVKQEVYSSSSFDGEFVLERKLSPKTLYFDFGTQYKNSINDNKLQYVIGVVGGFKRKVGLEETSTASKSSTELTSDINLLGDEYIPSFFGLGASVKTEYWVFGADYRMDHWGDVAERNGKHIYKNASKIALGAEYSPNVLGAKSIFQRMIYQVGAKYEQSNLKLNSVNLDGYALTAGIEVPGRRMRTSFGLSMEYGKRGSLENGLIRENYFQMNLHLNMSDIWFIKQKYQ